MVSLVTVAGLLGMTSTGVVLNAYVKKANDPQLAVMQVMHQLPPGEKLVSFGRVDHLFAYHFEKPILFHPLPTVASEVDQSVRYFAIDGGPIPVAELPFAWKEVATVVLDRNRIEKPARTVIIGRRLDETIAQQAHSPQVTRTPRRR